MPPALRIRSTSASAPGVSPWCTRSTASARRGCPSRSSLLRSTSRSAAPFSPSPGQSGGTPGPSRYGSAWSAGATLWSARSRAPVIAQAAPAQSWASVRRPSAAAARSKASAAGLPALLGRTHLALEQRGQAGVPEPVEDQGWQMCRRLFRRARSRSTRSPWTWACTSSGAMASAAVDGLRGRREVACRAGHPGQSDLRPQQLGPGQLPTLRARGSGASRASAGACSAPARSAAISITAGPSCVAGFA